jgi:hypothetical protein
MNAQPFTKPVRDSVPKVAGDVAVGEDLEFQRKWWRFERVVWSIFALILICDLLGLFGRGWLAKAERSTPDRALTLDYERVQRASTPSAMTLHLGPPAVHDGHVQVFVSEDVIKPLGAQRISPQPAVSSLGDGGVTYTFDATGSTAVVEITSEPSLPGVHHFRMRVPGDAEIEASVVVVP